jgi:hypothetical protein
VAAAWQANPEVVRLLWQNVIVVAVFMNVLRLGIVTINNAWTPSAQVCGCYLGALAKLRKVIINSVMSVCPSAWNNSVPTGRIFMKFDLSIFENLLKNSFQRI